MVHQYVRGVRGPGGFPPPARARGNGAAGQPLWDWSDVAEWLCRNAMAPESLLRDAEALDTINCVLDYTRKRKRDAALVREVQSRRGGQETRLEAAVGKFPCSDGANAVVPSVGGDE